MEQNGRPLQHIDSQCNEVNATIGRAQRKISLLREYRTRLIADVVTGKLDVREAAARLPEEDPLRDFATSRDAEPDAEPDADSPPEEDEA
jgi:type I restriction enzyme, S subunit